MFCVIYRSTKREQTYLYVEKKDDFSRVPDELMRSFGTPQMAMYGFAVFYALCLILKWWFYLRAGSEIKNP